MPGIIIWPEMETALLNHWRGRRGKWRETRTGFESQEVLVQWGSGGMDREVM